MSSGTITATNATVGSGTKPMFMSSGTLTASSSTVGSGTTGIYLSSGTITAMSYSLSATVNAGAANRMAYYSGANAISQASSIYASTTALAINKTSAPANSGNFQVVGTSTMRHIYPEANNSYDLGSTSLRWKSILYQGSAIMKMDADTSNAKVPLAVANTSNTVVGDIGYHNTGDTNGAFVITPYEHSGTNFWGGAIGLYIGKNNLKWENKYILRYSATATTGKVIISDGTVGNVKTSSYSIGATVNAGTANRLAYYSGANEISASSTLVSNGTYIRRAGVSSSWNNTHTNSFIYQTSVNGLSPIMSIITTGNHYWSIAHYNHASYHTDLLFGFLHADDVEGATNANNRWRDCISLIPVTDAGTSRRAFVTATYTRSSATNGTAATGGNAKPVYINAKGIVIASTATVGSTVIPVYMSSGTITATNATVGSGTKPIFMSSGTLTASSSTVGASNKPVFLSSGTITASSSTIGSTVIPVYMSSGTITATNATVGSGTKPMFMSSGTLTASSSTVGSGTKPMFMSSGTLTASSSTVGSGTKGVYLSSGTITAMSYSLSATVNAGTANTLAYYSGANAISSGTNLQSNGSYIHIINDADIGGGAADTSAPFTIGTLTSQHIAIDNNEILSKSNATTPSTLFLQDSSGIVQVNGTGGLKVWDINIATGATTDAAKRTISSTSTLYLNSAASTSLIFQKAGAEMARFNTDSHFVPSANATRDLGTGALRWRTLYLSNYIYVGPTSYTAWNSSANGVWINTTDVGIHRTSAGGGFYVHANGTQQARLYLATLGTANSGDGNATRGAQGEVYLYLGNNVARPAAGTAGGANNSRGRIIIYGTGTGGTTIMDGSWSGNHLTVVTGTNSTAGSTTESIVIVGNSNKKSAAAGSSTGRIRLYGEEANYHDIYPGAPDGNRTHYLPNATGWIATGGNGTSTGVGNTTQPVYLSSSGILTACTPYSSASVSYASTAGTASSAGSVAWGNVTGKPSTFTPSSHNHDDRYLKLSGGTLTGYLTLTGCESNNISNVYNNNGTITNIPSVTLASIRHSIKFPWYSTSWEIGNIRGGSTDSLGFGITKGNSKVVFRVNDSGGWINESQIITSSNISSYVGSGGGGNYLPLSGGTMTGTINLRSNAYSGPSGTYGMNCNNSDIINVNSIYTSDLSDGWDEGILFRRTNGNWDSFRAADGNFYFSVNNGSNLATLNNDGLYLTGSNGWIRTYGSCGWYSQDYGGGWYMTDSTFIRTYNGKILHMNVNNNSYGASGHHLAADFYNPEHICIGLRNNSCSWYICSHSNTNMYIGYRPNGNVSGYSSDSYPVYITNGGSVYSNSDRKLKKNISFISKSELNDLFDNSDSLFRKFTWKSDNTDSYGFIAQELEEFIPEAVSEDIKGIKHVSYNVAYAKIMASLVNKIKELENENNNLKLKIEDLYKLIIK